MLLDKVQSCSNVELKHNQKFKSVFDNGEELVVTSTDAQGHEVQLPCSHVIAADGGNSDVRSFLGGS